MVDVLNDISDISRIDCDIYGIDSFNARFNGVKDLFMVNFNVRSFNANIDEFLGYLNLLYRVPDIIVLTETWFTPSYSEEIDGYISSHCVRPEKVGGGVSVYVGNNLNAKIVPKTVRCTDILEMCSVDIMFYNGPKVHLFAIYRPPVRSNIDSFFVEINEMLSVINVDEVLMVCGDLNINLAHPDLITNRFVETMKSLSLLPIITQPTRVTENSASIIDHFWSSSLLDISSGVLMSGITDHYPTFMFLPIRYENKLTKISFRDHSEACLSQFRHNLSLFLSTTFSSYDDVDFIIRFKMAA